MAAFLVSSTKYLSAKTKDFGKDHYSQLSEVIMMKTVCLPVCTITFRNFFVRMFQANWLIKSWHNKNSFGYFIINCKVCKFIVKNKTKRKLDCTVKPVRYIIPYFTSKAYQNWNRVNSGKLSELDQSLIRSLFTFDRVGPE